MENIEHDEETSPSEDDDMPHEVATKMMEDQGIWFMEGKQC